MQDMQKQRLLQPDSPRSPSSQRPQQTQPLSNHSPRQAQQMHQQLQSQSPQQASDQSDDDWTWPQSTALSPNQQATDLASQPPGGSQLAQNGSRNAAQPPLRPRSASASSPAPQDIDGSQHSATTSRSRTGTASPRLTNDALVSMASKNVSWQVGPIHQRLIAQGLLTCHLVTFTYGTSCSKWHKGVQNQDICALACVCSSMTKCVCHNAAADTHPATVPSRTS